MDNNSLKVKVDSSQARADLAALSMALEKAGLSANKMAGGFQKGMGEADTAVKGSLKNMERFAQAVAIINRVKIDAGTVNSVSEFASALSKLSRVKEIDRARLDSWRKFVEVGALVSKLKINNGATNSLLMFANALNTAAKTREISIQRMSSWSKFIELAARTSQLRMGAHAMVGLNMFAQSMDQAARARAIQPAKLKSWVDFITIAARTGQIKFNSQTPASIKAFSDAIAQLKVPGKASIERLERLFQVLAAAKRIPGALQISRDLDQVAQAAARAASALDRLPMRLRASMGGSSANGMVRQMNQTVAATQKAQAGMSAFGGSADKAGKHAYTLSERLRGLNHRFDLAYQAGTAFSLLFSTFTIGAMVKSIYDAGIEIQKLEKAMLFTTKSFEGSKRATNEFIGTVFELGLSLDQVMEPFGRFTISAAAVGMTAQESGAIFKSVTSTLQVVGASAQQTGYAMYGLTQMIQKGKVSSEEFNRQIGEQIPGNAEAGRRALERLKGEAVSMQQFFKEMSLGKIMSDDFTKLWAEELDKMFGPLLAMVRDRPDVAINRFNTAMAQFRIEIGKNQFMQEIGTQFARLADSIGTVKDGVFELNAPFKELASKLGRNLADMVRAAADAALWLAENFDKVIFTVKLIATFTVARTILSWGQAAVQTASSFEKLTKAILGLNVAQQAAGASGAAGALAGAGGVAGAGAVGANKAKGAGATGTAAAALMGASLGDIMTWRGANGRAPNKVPAANSNLAAVAGGFGKRAQAPTGTAFTMQRGGATSAVMAQRTQLTQGSMLSRVGGAAASAGGAAAGAMNMGNLARVGATVARGLGLVGVAAVALGATMVMLSDKTMDLGNALVKGEDMSKAAMKLTFEGLINWFNRLTGGFGSFDDIIKDSGQFLLTLTETFMWMGEVVGDTVGALVHFGFMIKDIVTGDWGKIGGRMENLKRDWSDNNIFNADVSNARIDKLREKTIDEALARTGREQGNLEAEARARQAAQILAQQQAAADQVKAAEIQNAAAIKMTKALTTTTVNDVIERGFALASGRFAAANPAKTAEQRVADNTATANAAAAAQAAAAPPLPTATTPTTQGGLPLMEVDLTPYNVGKMLPKVSGTSRNALESAIVEAIKGYTEVHLGRAFTEADRTRGQAFASRLVNPVVDARLAQNQQNTTVQTATAGQANASVLNTARRYIGQNETANNASLKGLFSTAGINVDPAKVAWCAAFVNAVLAQNGIQGTGTLKARDFLNQGTAVNAADAQAGDVVVLRRGNDPQKGHVGIYQGTDANGRIRIVGGNQGRDGRVSEASYAQSEVLGIRRMGGGTGSAGAAAVGSAADVAQNETDTAVNKRTDDFRALLSLVQAPDAASQAVAGISQMAEQFAEIFERDEARQREFGRDAGIVSNPIMEAAVKRFKQLSQAAADAINPVAASNRLLKDQNQITGMIVAGRSKEAEWQQKLNEMREQYGADYVAMMQDSAKWEEYINGLKATNQYLEVESLETARKEWELQRDRTRLLETEARLVETINNARVGAMAGGVSRQQGYLNDLINGLEGGGTFENKRATAMADPALWQRLQQTAAAQDMGDRVGALRNMSVSAQDAISTAGMSESQRAFQTAYAAALREMTGMTNASIGEIMAELEKSGDNVTAGLAEGYAKLMEELDNPPGFQRWVDALEPLHKRMQDIKGQFLDALSDGITDALMGEEVDWKNIMKGIRREMVKASVDSLMGDIMGFMGVKKGEAKLSPESQAMIERLDAARAANEVSLQQMSDSVVAAIAAREDSLNEKLATSATEQTSLVAQQTDALTVAANALQTIAGSVSGGAGLPRATPTAATTPTAAGPVGDTLTQMANTLVGADTAAGGASEVLQPYTPGRVDPLVQATIPQASPFANRTQNKTKWWQRAGQALLGKYWGGHETDTRFATAGRMSNAAGANSQPGISDIATSGGEGGGDSGLGQAAQALAGSASSMMQVASAFSATIPQFTAAIENFEAAIAKLAESGGGGGGGGMPDISQLIGGGGGSGGGTGFGGQAIPEDLIGLFADGGYIAGRGGPRSDSIPARLSNGEFVINAKATAQNRPLLEAINSNSVPGFADGGEASWTSKFFGKGNDGKYNGGGSSVGKMFGKGNDGETRLEGFMEGAALVSTIMDIFKKPKQLEKEPDAVKGVIGEHRAVTVDATQIAAHSNPIADLIDIGMNMATGGTWGKVKTGTNMVASMFADGGYVGAGSVDWSSVPHYAEGTPDTSGIPAVVHPGEAIIPLSGGRKVPVEMGDQQSSPQFNSTFHIHAKDADSFRQSQGQIQRKQNLAMKRSSTRNLA